MNIRTSLFFGLVCLLTLTKGSPSGETDNADTIKYLKTRPEAQFEILKNLLEKNSASMKYIRPVGSNGSEEALSVNVNFFLRHIHELDAEAGTLKLQMTFRQQWHDSRLVFTPTRPEILRISVPDELKKEIWQPDTYFAHEVEAEGQHILTKPNSAIWIYPDGNVLASERLTLTLACPQVRFTREPTCRMRIESFGFKADDLVYNWKENEPVQIPKEMLNVPWDPVMMPDNLLPKGFSFKAFDYARCDYVKNPVDKWSCVQAVFKFRKNDVCPTTAL